MLNAHKVSDIRQTETHTTEPLIPETNPSEIENATKI
jgi:hypothetical protein